MGNEISETGYHDGDYKADQGGAYEYGYDKGYGDRLDGTSDIPESYAVPAISPSGNEGYADGWHDAGNQPESTFNLGDIVHNFIDPQN